MFMNRCYDNGEIGTKMNKSQMSTNTAMPMMDECCGNTCPPVMECPCERVCHRQICYEVPHIIPVNTRIINHHIYKHTYQPCFTCTMEDEVCNVYDNKCGF